MNRLDKTLAALGQSNRSGLVAYFTAGDPTPEATLDLLRGLSGAGADVIELGMPFSDPVADGPIIQRANTRALQAGQTMEKTLSLVGAFRQHDARTPLVLMGYLNPILRYAIAPFMADASAAGVDGLIVLDLPPEHAGEMARAAQRNNIHLIRMTAPTTDDERLSRSLRTASGFVYHVMLAGTTGSALPTGSEISKALAGVRAQTGLPIAAGFGIRSPEQARLVARHADLVVVGSRLVEVLEQDGIDAALKEVGALARALAS
jgi:tryptophan synthase alpha chain